MINITDKIKQDKNRQYRKFEYRVYMSELHAIGLSILLMSVPRSYDIYLKNKEHNFI